MQGFFTAGGKSIRIDMHEPQTARPHAAIILLHGSGGNVERWGAQLAPQLNAAGIALYAPHYFDRTATTRADLTIIADGIHVPQWLETLDAALAFAAARPGVDPQRIALVGVSLGAFLSLAFAAQLSDSPHPAARRRIRAIIDLSGGLVEPYAAQATEHFPPTLILHGEADNIVTVKQAHTLDAILTDLGVTHETLILPGEGHWFTPAAQPQLLLAVSGFLSKYL